MSARIAVAYEQVWRRRTARNAPTGALMASVYYELAPLIDNCRSMGMQCRAEQALPELLALGGILRTGAPARFACPTSPREENSASIANHNYYILDSAKDAPQKRAAQVSRQNRGDAGPRDPAVKKVSVMPILSKIINTQPAVRQMFKQSAPAAKEMAQLSHVGDLMVREANGEPMNSGDVAILQQFTKALLHEIVPAGQKKSGPPPAQAPFLSNSLARFADVLERFKEPGT